MANIKQSGYHAAETTVSFTGTQTLASLASDEYTDPSDAIDNSTNKYAFMDWEFVCTAVNFVSPASIRLYVLPSLDGTNYAQWDGNVATDVEENEQYFADSCILNPGNNAQRHVRDSGILVPRGLFKVAVRNKGGIALAASGSTLKLRFWSWDNT